MKNKAILFAALSCALLGTNAYTVLEGVRAVNDAHSLIQLERDIAYEDGYTTALLDVAVGACNHIPAGQDYDACMSRFNQLIDRMSAEGKQAQGVTNE